MSCAAFGCTSNYKKKEDGVRFIRFPKDEETRKKWAVAMKRDQWKPNDHSRLCSKHFKTDDFDISSPFYISVKPGVIPSVFPAFPPHLQTPIPKERRPLVRKAPQDVNIENIDNPAKLRKIIRTQAKALDELGEEKMILQAKEVQASQELNRKEEELKQKINTIVKKNKSLKNLRSRCSYLKKEITSVRNLCCELKEKNLILQDHADMLTGISPTSFALIKREHKQATKHGKIMNERYDEQLKSFAITLNFLSAKAYEFVRCTFNSCLPHPRTIGRWYSNINGDPGFNAQAFNTIKIKNEHSKNKLVVAIMIDGMAIRQKSDWRANKLYGHVNYGVPNNDISSPLATEAIFFHMVSVNSAWKIPLGYFLVAGISGEQLCSLIHQCLDNLSDCKVNVCSITFDGASSNVAASKLLSCNFNFNTEQPKTYFDHGEKQIEVIFDTCHMLKLVRNTLHDLNTLIDVDGKEISWKYIVNLVTFQEEIGLKLGNKVSTMHVSYANQKMKVKLAAQVLSDSVADALIYCQRNSVPNFTSCDATVKFIKIFNKLFDILNSRSIKARFDKQAIHPGNSEKIFRFFKEAKSYILGLRSQAGLLITMSNRKTGFLGFLGAMESICRIYHSFVVINRSLNYIPTYKLSQDHLERLFGYIRNRGGHNNNPSAFELCYTMKRILVHKELHESKTGCGNAIPYDKIQILQISTAKPWEKINASVARSAMLDDDEKTLFFTAGDELLDHCYSMNALVLSQVDFDIADYMGGYAIKSTSKLIKCSECIAFLHSGHSEEEKEPSLIFVKNRGGLIIPPRELSFLFRSCEKIFRQQMQNSSELNIARLSYRVLKLINNHNFCDNIDHFYGSDDNHFLPLIETLINKYFKIRCVSVCNNINQKKNRILNEMFLIKLIYSREIDLL